MNTKVNQGLLKQAETLQTKYPHFIVGGSVALYLHGVRLQRWDHVRSDLDIVMPYYTKIDGSVDETNKTSGADFDYSVKVHDIKLGSVKVDCLIEPKARYEIVKFNDVEYKVVPLLTIIEAKLRYALKGNQKHINDLHKILLAK
jgi:hypothetical protein